MHTAHREETLQIAQVAAMVDEFKQRSLLLLVRPYISMLAVKALAIQPEVITVEVQP
jgi:hypothetical protein